MTGATGFVGKSLFDVLKCRYSVSLVLRGNTDDFKDANAKFHIGSFSKKTDFSECVKSIGCVVHLAAKAHKRSNTSLHSINELREINTHATLKLARQAAESGVRRFVFISSIGVNGTSNTSPFNTLDKPNPIEDYSISKYEAEIGLKEISKNTGMEVVIIRPPLVYGKNAPGNFGTLLKVAETKLPLPLGAINNQRSFVAIDNLVDLIVTCIEHPNAANQTFLVSDDENISTSNLLKKLTLAAGKKPCLLPVPISILKFLASIVGKKSYR